MRGITTSVRPDRWIGWPGEEIASSPGGPRRQYTRPLASRGDQFTQDRRVLDDQHGRGVRRCASGGLLEAGLRHRDARQVDLERCPCRVRYRPRRCHRSLDKPVHHRGPKSGALPFALVVKNGSKIRAWTSSVIPFPVSLRAAYVEPGRPRGGGGHRFSSSSTRMSQWSRGHPRHGMPRIDDQVHQCLLHLTADPPGQAEVGERASTIARRYPLRSGGHHRMNRGDESLRLSDLGSRSTPAEGNSWRVRTAACAPAF